MTTEKMTIHEALSELKVLNSRIINEVSKTSFVITNKHSNTKIDGLPITKYENDTRASYDRITDLIKRRAAIRRAVVKSNSVTEITINEETMTVAEVIEFKNTGIDYLITLRDRISRDYEVSVKSARTANGESIENKASEYVVRLFGGKDNSVDNSVIEAAKKTFIENNTIDIIDPIDAEKTIRTLTNYIDGFKSKVDSALSVSNATTIIEITY